MDGHANTMQQLGGRLAYHTGPHPQTRYATSTNAGGMAVDGDGDAQEQDVLPEDWCPVIA
jgi:hypothetical protein